MKEVVANTDPKIGLTEEERKTFCLSYRSVVCARRDSWRAIRYAQKVAEREGNETDYNQAKEYGKSIANDLTLICSGAIEMLEKNLIVNAGSSVLKVFYWKLTADFYRYIAETATLEKYWRALTMSLAAYEQARVISSKDLDALHPLRLGVALNTSVLYTEVLNRPDVALEQAQQALESAHVWMMSHSIEFLDNEANKPSRHILELLNDNIALWNSVQDNVATEDDTQEAENV